MATAATTEELIARLSCVEGKAEIVGGEIMMMSPTGGKPGRAGGRIYASLLAIEKDAGGFAYPDNVGFLTNLPGRSSFSPDAAFSTEKPGMEFATRPPDFAVEVRSENDYGPAAEEKIAAKRADYFAAGIKVVWDVDLLGEDTVHVYRADKPGEADVYRKGDSADAEPAVPGWRFRVDELFD